MQDCLRVKKYDFFPCAYYDSLQTTLQLVLSKMSDFFCITRPDTVLNNDKLKMHALFILAV